jgi:hypothetical protein
MTAPITANTLGVNVFTAPGKAMAGERPKPFGEAESPHENHRRFFNPFLTILQKVQFGFTFESFLQDLGETLLMLGHPSGIMRPDNIFGVAHVSLPKNASGSSCVRVIQRLIVLVIL